MLRINELRLEIEHDEKELEQKIRRLLNTKKTFSYKIVRRSLDARKKPVLFFSYIIDVSIEDEAFVLKHADKKIVAYNPIVYSFPYNIDKMENNKRPVIVGLGPAGLFCGLYLAEHGFKPIILERGEKVECRANSVDEFWNNNNLNTESNVQFGEGGAGAFSDGKLNTLVKDKTGRNTEVLKRLVEFGALEDILYDHKPHIGTDRLRKVVSNISDRIRECGGDIYYNTRFDRINLSSGKLISFGAGSDMLFENQPLALCIGHSARDTFEMLYKEGVYMEAKAFAVGLRVEHDASLINQSQYGSSNIPRLGNANYKLTHKCKDGRGVYSFCMCPGGFVVNASSENGRLAINGMSYSKRDEKKSNSAIIVSVEPKDYGDLSNPLAGINFQRRLEEKAFEIGRGYIPVESYKEYKSGIIDENIAIDANIKGKYNHAKVSDILPSGISLDFIEGMEKFGNIIKGFNNDDTLVMGIESRTSSPVRITRDSDFQALNIEGLFPVGEGAGYAGGITSAAMDGIAAAEKIAEYILKKQ